jgi:hypothetical protein
VEVRLDDRKVGRDGSRRVIIERYGSRLREVRLSRSENDKRFRPGFRGAATVRGRLRAGEGEVLPIPSVSAEGSTVVQTMSRELRLELHGYAHDHLLGQGTVRSSFHFVLKIQRPTNKTQSAWRAKLPFDDPLFTMPKPNGPPPSVHMLSVPPRRRRKLI